MLNEFVVTFNLLEAPDAIVALNCQRIGLKDWNGKMQLNPEGVFWEISTFWIQMQDFLLNSIIHTIMGMNLN